MGKSTVNSLQDLQLNDGEFQTAGALTLKALADNVNDVCGTVSNSLSSQTASRVIVMDYSSITLTDRHQDKQDSHLLLRRTDCTTLSGIALQHGDDGHSRRVNFGSLVIRSMVIICLPDDTNVYGSRWGV